MRLQLIEQGNVGGGDAIHCLGEQVSAQFVGGGLADQPQMVLGKPASRAGLVEFELFFGQVTQACE